MKAALLLSSIFCLLVTASSSPNCRTVSYGRACTGLSVTQLSLAGQVLLVGGNNSIYSFDTSPRLEVKESFSIAPSSDRISQCKIDTVTLDSSTECGNVVRVLQQVSSAALSAAMLSNDSMETALNDSVMVCGTNAFYPKCTFHKIYNLSDWIEFETGNALIGFSPYSVTSKSIGLLGSNGRFYTGTNFGRFSTSFRISVALHPLRFNRSFDINTHSSSPIWFSISSTDFVSIYEIGDYIYVFLNEPAEEVDEGNSITYARVVRFCKSDPGFLIGNIPPVLFSTFQKVRITCSYSRHKSSPKFYYDRIISTYLNWQNDSTPSPTLYATFSSSINGPEGTAVCKFSFDPTVTGNINSLFDSDTQIKYYVTGSSTTLAEEMENAFVCPGKSGRQRSESESQRHQLLVGEVESSAILTRDGQTFTSIVVDMFKYNNSVYEAVYVGTKDGRIFTSVFSNGKLFKTLDDIKLSNESVIEMLLSISNETKIRRIYASTEGLVADVTHGNCSRYMTCMECLESRDLYCSWQNGSCINKLLSKAQEAMNPPSNTLDYCAPPNSASSTSISIVFVPSSSNIPSKTVRTITASTTVSTSSTRNAVSSTPIVTVTRTTLVTTTRIILVTTEPVTSTLHAPTVQPTIGSVGTTTMPSVGEMVGGVIGGLLVGFIIGSIICFVGLAVKRKLMKPEAVSTNETSNGGSTVTERRPRHRQGSVGHYTITVDLPGGGQEEIKVIEEEDTGNENLSPPSPSVVVIDSELEDDVITDLPIPGVSSNHKNKRGVSGRDRGRTESTRWLRASESEASTNGTESPQSP
ncbi:PREDICTED: semaphorin-5B-like [Amphimedon queenslandica]|uniref:Sema domain-containing protein n=1 Tax=Amphimedon queenslandica TaxID=400682 RepID=A0A1X7V5N9_AMPQE|nr:PREDICTED: semaphorin-5B-like [Amphimedon queenslandica]|eukprot:XP_011403136.1 PREDICTED: semaphorin-5B-like [Amphimedon queenslandica]